ncbi:MAG: ABC transporter substrate-binding protein [Candidatus Bathyarchaeia archaeon]
MKTTRREYLKLVGAAAAGAAVSGGLVYWLTRPQPKEQIIIGSMPDLTGFLAATGYWHDKAVAAAANYINEEEGGIDGRTLVVVTEDAASSADVATKKIRKLVLERGAMAIVPSMSGAIGIAVGPIIKDELKVPYLYTGGTYTVLLRGNRYIFQWHTSAKAIARAFKDIIPTIGKKWAIPYLDYAYGWSLRDEFKNVLAELGSDYEVVADIPVPSGTTDFYPYMSKIPQDTEGIWWGLVGLAEATGGIKALRELGYDQLVLSDFGIFPGVDLASMLPLFEGCIFYNNYPHLRTDRDTTYLQQFQDMVGIDVDGSEKGNPKNHDVNASYLAWEGVFAIAEAIKGSGWTKPEDTPELIKWLEGHHFKESLYFPGGDFYIRAVDHHTFRPVYIHKVENGQLKLQTIVPAEESEFPNPDVDFSNEPF